MSTTTRTTTTTYRVRYLDPCWGYLAPESFGELAEAVDFVAHAHFRSAVERHLPSGEVQIMGTYDGIRGFVLDPQWQAPVIALMRTPAGLAIGCGCGGRPLVDGPAIVTCGCGLRYDPQGWILEGYRRVCCYCRRDMGPVPEGTTTAGDSHGMCTECETPAAGCAWCGTGDGICGPCAHELRTEAL